MKSNSATDKNINDYDWHAYKGKNKTKLTNKNHTTFLADGAIYGIRQLRGMASDSVIIMQDNLKIDYRITAKQAVLLERKSTKARKPRNLEKKLTAVKNKRVVTNTSDYQKNKQAWDSDRYQGDGKRLPSAKTGLDLSKFQWRRLVEPELRVTKTAKIGRTYYKGSYIGFRFDSPARGGLVVDQLGNSFNVGAEMYDHAVSVTKLVPKNKWFEDKLSSSEIAQNKAEESNLEEQAKQIRKDIKSKENAAIKRKRLAVRKKQIAERKAQKEKEKGTVEEYRKTEETRLELEIEQKKKNNRRLTPEEKLAAFLDSSIDSPEDEDEHIDLNIDSRGRAIEDPEEDLPDDLDAEEDKETEEENAEDEDAPAEEEKPDFGNRDLDKDQINSEIDDGLGELIDQKKDDLGLNDIDEDEQLDGDDLSEEDEDDDPEEDDDDDGEDDSGEDSTEDDGEEDDDPEEDGDGEDLEEDGEDDDLEEDGDDDDLEEDDEEPTSDDLEGLDDDEDDDTGGDSDLSDPDDDVAAAEDEDANVSKDKDNSDTKKSDGPYEPRLGHVLKFKRDKEKKRDFIILDTYTLTSNDNITAYKLYDITNQPNEYSLVLIPKNKGMSLSEQVVFVRRSKRDEFKDYLKMALKDGNMDESRDAIVS